MISDFENLNLINYLHDNKDANTQKSMILNKTVSEIAKLQRKTKQTEKTDEEIIMDILFLNGLNNNLMASILLWLFFWLDKDLFIDDLNKLINKNGSVLKSIKTIRNPEDKTFIHGLKN